MSNAREIEQQAALWLVRWEEPSWSANDQEKLDQWLTESDAHKVAFWRLQHGWREADRIASIAAAAPTLMKPRVAVPEQWWKPLAAAASFLLVLGAYALQGNGLPFQHQEMVQTASFSTPVGGRKAVSLPDGSRVELNTATALRAAVGSGKRAIWLQKGEAYFDVAPRKDQLFVVYAGSQTVTVLGTKFSVRRDGSEVTVVVSEGRVRVEDSRSNRARSATITAGDIATADGLVTRVEANSETRLDEQLAWRTGRLLFDGTTLADAATEFNRYNDRQLVIGDSATAQTQIGGTFEANNVEAFARLLEEAYGLRVQTNSDKIMVSN